MAVETERKYLVSGEFMGDVTERRIIKQGYLSTDPDRTVRIRISDDKGFLTIKGKSTEDSISRYEFEREIPLKDAEELFRLCLPGAIEKVRYIVPFGGYIWEVDIFSGDNEGLILAEIELPDECASYEIPPWIGKEVTGDKRYYNAMLSLYPYKNWKL